MLFEFLWLGAADDLVHRQSDFFHSKVVNQRIKNRVEKCQIEDCPSQNFSQVPSVVAINSVKFVFYEMVVVRDDLDDNSDRVRQPTNQETGDDHHHRP